MRENTEDAYISAHDEAWDAFVRSAYPTRRRTFIPPSKWECFSAGFSAGVKYGRTTPRPPSLIIATNDDDDDAERDDGAS